jgi:hypothetical protein
MQEVWTRIHGAALVVALALLVTGLAGKALAGWAVSGTAQRTASLGADRYLAETRSAVSGKMRRYRDTVLAVAASLSAQQDLRAADFEMVTMPLRQGRLAGASGVASSSRPESGRSGQCSDTGAGRACRR